MNSSFNNYWTLNNRFGDTMKINWNSFTPLDFESLCATILEMNEFRNIEWYGASGGDRGRDLMAKKKVDYLNSINDETTWVVQCRRYTVKPPSKTDIHDWLVCCIEHNPHCCLLMVTNTLSSDVKDWLKKQENEFRFKVLVWEERDLVREIVKHKRTISSQFPQLYSIGSAIEFYELDSGEFRFGCSEFEEVEFCVHNCFYKEEAKEKILDFIEFLKANDPIVK